MTTTFTTRTRDDTRNIFKRVQRFLGPQVTTPRNAAFAALSMQTMLIALLLWILRSKDATIQRLASADSAIKSSLIDCGTARDDIYGLPPAEYNQPLQAAIDEANYDDTSASITGLVEIKKYTTFFGRFLRCKAAPCEIKHWPVVHKMCALREKHNKDKKAHNASVWNLVQDDMYYSLHTDFGCPMEICRRSWKEEMELIVPIASDAIKMYYKNDTSLKSTAWKLENIRNGNAYVRMNQFFGLEYMFHGYFTLVTKSADNQLTQMNKSGTVIVRRGFKYTHCDSSFNADVLEADQPVYVIVPYTGRIDQLQLFYENIRKLLNEGVSLRVVIATHGGAVHLLGASELLREMAIGLIEGELRDGHTVQVVEVRGDRYGNFSRAVALMDGLAYVPADALVFYCDVDMMIEREFFDNCRHNTQRNHMVYYPIVYSLYPYGKRVSREHGYWRSGAFGMLCVYKSDMHRNPWWKHHAHKLRGWGMEDVLLRRGFNDHWQINVFHAVEPNLLHRWHPKYCEWNDNVAACLGTIFQNMGSQRFLASIVAGSGIDVRSVAYDPQPVNFSGYRNASDNSTKANSLQGASAFESQTDQNKKNDLKDYYERVIKNGQGGLISVFAKEAQDAMMGSAHLNHLHQHVPPRPQPAAMNIQQNQAAAHQVPGAVPPGAVPVPPGAVPVPPGAVPVPPGAVPVPPGAVPVPLGAAQQAPAGVPQPAERMEAAPVPESHQDEPHLVEPKEQPPAPISSAV